MSSHHFQSVLKGFPKSLKAFPKSLKAFQKGFQSVSKGFPKGFKPSETGSPKGFTGTSNPLENAFVDKTCFHMEGHIYIIFPTLNFINLNWRQRTRNIKK